MTKKITQQTQRINKGRFQAKNIKPQELKAFATKKVQQLQTGKKVCSKISKVRSQAILSPMKLFKVQKELFKEIIDQSVFQCPICLQLMIEPTLLQCGHAYCFKCIEQLMIYKSNCGVCRNLQKEPQFQRSQYLETLIEKVVLQKSQHFLDFYCRVADTQNWKRVRNVAISELSKGSFIDFRDKELKWRKAEIIRIYFDQWKGSYQMDVKYKKEGENIEETISSNSGRYAKFSYYTRMKYLEPRPNMQVAQVSASQQVLMAPIPNSFRDLSEDLREFQNLEQNETPYTPLQQNIELDETILPYFQENQFLNQIFSSNEPQVMDFIQILV